MSQECPRSKAPSICAEVRQRSVDAVVSSVCHVKSVQHRHFTRNDVLKTFRTTLNHMTSDLTLNHFIFCYSVNLEQPLHHLSNFIPERCDTSDNYGLNSFSNSFSKQVELELNI